MSTPSMRRVAIVAITLTITGLGGFALAQSVTGGFEGFWGSKYTPRAEDANRSSVSAGAIETADLARRRRPAPFDPRTRLIHWNRIAIDASGVDHTPVASGENRVFGEQLGPGRSSRAMAMVHIAMFDALNAVVGGFTSYTGTQAPHGPMSVDAAIRQAAHDSLAALFPSQAPTFDAYLAEDLAAVRNAHQKANGIVLGQRAAAAILAMRLNDGSQIPEPHIGVDYFPSDQPGHWRQDPISLIPLALGAHWGECMPFVVNSTSQFRAPPPPNMTSAAYTAAYNEVKSLGREGPPTQRTEEQTFIGIFWAYDGTPSLCAPPRLYNQLTVHIADERGMSAIQFARLLGLMNVAMADAAMTVWESKYYYD